MNNLSSPPHPLPINLTPYPINLPLVSLSLTHFPINLVPICVLFAMQYNHNYFLSFFPALLPSPAFARHFPACPVPYHLSFPGHFSFPAIMLLFLSH